ncbi:Putative peroxiredoxin bcp [Acaryochloris thomasi RCC1774]|uniref:thioredoxin-dependent peroxiredoxin n=1 Tax=Acaryochloris thomasi RCC1774 TaxID=1764569 RepID=A0A2W1JV10_9CYAN|nr:peroxiredoxin-like family protein [Acaryochloris thomasi]PZD74312.1 Putative peroxiredoxin bcp [Acaryochloris thomasi RCC1774]
MSLTTDLQTQKEQFLANVPDETVQVMGKATQALAESGIVDQSLKAGQQAPPVQLPNATGNTIDLQELLKSGPVVLSFYRGQWCPYCNLELRALQQILPEIQTLGASLVAVSPQTPDSSLSTVEKNELTYEVLSDVGNQVARAYGLVFKLPEHLRPIYNSFGIDVPAHNGDSSFELPIAATYVIATDGTIAHAFIDADYTQRLDPEAILTALKTLS